MRTRDKIAPVTINERGCWLWMANRNWFGYAQMRNPKSRKKIKVSRLVLEAKLGRPLKQKALHSCDNPPCVNPDHLFEGTNKENLQDMVRKGRHWNQKKTHCKYGHAFTAGNTYLHPTNGRRQCRQCEVIRSPRKTSIRYRGQIRRPSRWRNHNDTIQSG